MNDRTVVDLPRANKAQDLPRIHDGRLGRGIVIGLGVSLLLWVAIANLLFLLLHLVTH